MNHSEILKVLDEVKLNVKTPGDFSFEREPSIKGMPTNINNVGLEIELYLPDFEGYDDEEEEEDDESYNERINNWVEDHVEEYIDDAEEKIAEEFFDDFVENNKKFYFYKYGKLLYPERIVKQLLMFKNVPSYQLDKSNVFNKIKQAQNIKGSTQDVEEYVDVPVSRDDVWNEILTKYKEEIMNTFISDYNDRIYSLAYDDATEDAYNFVNRYESSDNLYASVRNSDSFAKLRALKWTVVPDASLRGYDGGVEIKPTGRGIPIGQIKTHLKALQDFVLDERGYFEKNTGVHVHVSFRKELNPLQILTLLKKVDEAGIIEIFSNRDKYAQSVRSIVKAAESQITNAKNKAEINSTILGMLNRNKFLSSKYDRIVTQSNVRTGKFFGINTVTDYETIEFRHGTFFRIQTHNIMRFMMRWLNYINKSVSEATAATTYKIGNTTYTFKNGAFVPDRTSKWNERAKEIAKAKGVYIDGLLNSMKNNVSNGNALEASKNFTNLLKEKSLKKTLEYSDIIRAQAISKKMADIINAGGIAFIREFINKLSNDKYINNGRIDNDFMVDFFSNLIKSNVVEDVYENPILTLNEIFKLMPNNINAINIFGQNALRLIALKREIKAEGLKQINPKLPDYIASILISYDNNYSSYGGVSQNIKNALRFNKHAMRLSEITDKNDSIKTIYSTLLRLNVSSSDKLIDIPNSKFYNNYVLQTDVIKTEDGDYTLRPQSYRNGMQIFIDPIKFKRRKKAILESFVDQKTLSFIRRFNNKESSKIKENKLFSDGSVVKLKKSNMLLKYLKSIKDIRNPYSPQEELNYNNYFIISNPSLENDLVEIYDYKENKLFIVLISMIEEFHNEIKNQININGLKIGDFVQYEKTKEFTSDNIDIGVIASFRKVFGDEIYAVIYANGASVGKINSIKKIKDIEIKNVYKLSENKIKEIKSNLKKLYNKTKKLSRNTMSDFNEYDIVMFYITKYNIDDFNAWFEKSYKNMFVVDILLNAVYQVIEKTKNNTLRIESNSLLSYSRKEAVVPVKFLKIVNKFAEPAIGDIVSFNKFHTDEQSIFADLYDTNNKELSYSQIKRVAGYLQYNKEGKQVKVLNKISDYIYSVEFIINNDSLPKVIKIYKRFLAK